MHANTLFSAHTSHWNGRVGSNPSNRPHPPNPSNPSNRFVRHTYSVSPSFNAHHPQTYWSQWCSQNPLHSKNGKNRRTHPPPPPRDGGWSIARGHGTVTPAIAKAPLVLPPRVVKPPSIPQGIVTQLSDGAKQLVLDVFVCPPNAEKRKLKALIGTGAQINVMRRGLFPEETLQGSKRP